jgi:hypothetical protein
MTSIPLNVFPIRVPPCAKKNRYSHAGHTIHPQKGAGDGPAEHSRSFHGETERLMQYDCP